MFHRKASRTRGLALVAMLALKIVHALRRRIRDLDLTAAEAIERLAGVRLVTVAAPELGLWRLPQRWPPAVEELHAALPPLPAPRLSPT